MPPSIKEKIWKGDFIDLLSLLPNSKNFANKNDKRSDDGAENRRRPVTRSFYNWLWAFCIFSAVMGVKHPEKYSGLLQHLEHMLEAYKNFGGFGWFNYDESFCQKNAIYPNLKWGMKDAGLQLNLIYPQKLVFSKQPTTNPNIASVYKKGVCYAYNETQCKWSTSWRYRYEQTFCFGTHPVAKCFQITSHNQASRENSKSLQTSEAGKNVPLATAIPDREKAQLLIDRFFTGFKHPVFLVLVAMWLTI